MLSALSASAQETLTDAQCRDARAVALATVRKYAVSAALAQSFAKFAQKCDLETNFDIVPGTDDEKAFGEFRIKLFAIRRPA